MRYEIISQDYGDEDKIFMVYEVWDRNLNCVVSAHSRRDEAEKWIVEQGGQVENKSLELACL